MCVSIYTHVCTHTHTRHDAADRRLDRRHDEGYIYIYIYMIVIYKHHIGYIYTYTYDCYIYIYICIYIYIYIYTCEDLRAAGAGAAHGRRHGGDNNNILMHIYI